MAVRLTPKERNDETLLPLGFEALDDIKNGNTYTDENGNLISKAQLTQRLRDVKGTKRVVRSKLLYRLPSDPIESELRVTYVNTVVFGRLTSDELARVVHAATRNVYDALRGKK